MKIWKIVVSLLVAASLLLVSCTEAPATTTVKLDKIRLVGTTGPMSIPLAYMKEHNSKLTARFVHEGAGNHDCKTR